MTIPTLNELNELSAAEVSLLILRCLSTSDLCFHYMLLHSNTVADILNTSIDLITNEPTPLSNDELFELTELTANMKIYIET